MATSLNRLSARTVAAIIEPGRHADGGNLYLLVSKAGAKSWVFMYRQNGNSTWALDVMVLHRAGWLKPGQWGTYRPGLNLLAKEGQLKLMYDATFEDGTQRPIGEKFYIVSSPRHFGGSVPYLICPGNGCGRRVSKLYRSSGRFRCRRCSKLVCDCQRENWVDRTLRRNDKIRKKLGINHGAIAEPSQRPKYMRRKTYEKLLSQLQIIEDRWEI